MSGISLFPRSDGRGGARNHVLVLPSVVCATRVARDVAQATGAATIVHQHGCSQIGDDAARTGEVFEALATHPNVAAAVVVSLGCETLQGRRLAERIAARGQRVAFVGIQDSGGSERAFDEGRAASGAAVADVANAPRAAVAASELRVGVEASRDTPLAAALVDRLVAAGAGALVAAESLAGAGVTVVERAGRAEQQHVAFAAAGAQVIVSFAGDEAAPVGFPVCPVVAVAGGSALHRAIADDFDLDEAAGVEAIWRRILAVAEGDLTVSEREGEPVFALERLTMTM